MFTFYIFVIKQETMLTDNSPLSMLASDVVLLDL